MNAAFRSRRLPLVAVLVLLITVASLLIRPHPTAAQGTTGLAQGGHGYLRQPDGHFITIDVPGATRSMPMGINDQGQITGTYDDDSGRSHAFLLSGGRYHTLDHPKATKDTTAHGLSGTIAWGINNRGEIVGSYIGAGGTAHGFRYTRGEFTPIHIPGAQETWPFGINNRGQVTVQTVHPDRSQPQYLLDDGDLTPIAHPQAARSIVHRINDRELIVGVYTDTPNAKSQHSFLLHHGTYTRFDVPGAAYTGVNAATNDGSLTGYHVPEGSADGHGFVTRNGRITSFDAPGAAGTTAYDINERGQIVGTGFPPARHASQPPVPHAYRLPAPEPRPQQTPTPTAP